MDGGDDVDRVDVHEDTGKQFFNEEQFEVYRALGFHIADGIFSGRDRVDAEGHPTAEVAHGLDSKLNKNYTGVVK